MKTICNPLPYHWYDYNYCKPPSDLTVLFDGENGLDIGFHSLDSWDSRAMAYNEVKPSSWMFIPRPSEEPDKDEPNEKSARSIMLEGLRLAQLSKNY